MANKLRFKRGSNLANAGTPAEGEPLYNTTTGEFFIGDGTTSASSLTAIGGSGNTWRPVTAGGNSLSDSETLAFTAGSNVTISETGGAVTIASTDTTYSTMGSGNSYASGLVPTGSATHGDTYLRKDGTWGTPTDTDTVYTHPTTSGNKHIPSGGSAGQFLKYSSDGTAVWASDNNTTYTSSDFTHDNLSGVTANEHIDWTIDQGTTNIHSGNYTDTNTWRPLGTGASDACAGNDARLSDARTPTAHTHDYTPLDHIRSLGTQAFTGTATTAGLISEMEGDGAFDSYTSAFKTSWSYAGNFDMSDAGRFTETAGTSFLTWTDNSSDSTRGNITVLAIAPNTGDSAGKMFVYNDQGSGYSPGWREIWTSTSDGSGSGLDADLLDGQHASAFASASHTHSYLPLSGGTVTGTLGIDHAHWKQGSQYISTDPRWNSYAGNANNGNLHIWSTKSDGSTYGQVGLALYDGTNYQYLTTQNNTNHLFHNNNKIWTAGNDGSGSGLDADLLDGVQGASFLRSDASDSVSAGVTYTWGATNTEGLRFTNSSYAKSLYIGGWSSANTAGISRIRNSNDNLHLDSGANGHMYLNHYSTGNVYIRGNTALHAGNYSSYANFGSTDLTAGNITGNEIYTEYWLRNKRDNHGVYNEANASGWYSYDNTWMIWGSHGSKYIRANHIYQDGAGGYCVSTSGTSSNYIQKGNASYRVQNTTMTDDGSTISTSGHTLKVEGGSMGSVFARPTGYTTAWTRRSGRMGIYRTPEGYDTCLLYHYDGSTLRWTSGTAYKGGGQNLDWTLIKDYDQYVTSGGVWRNPTIRASTNGNIYSATGSFNNSSDERLKRNITDLTKGLEHIKQMRPITYNRYLPDDDKVMDKTEVGFIAQEMLEIGLDEVVEGNNEDAKYYTLNYGSVTAYLVKAMQEMVEKIESLETKIEEMQNGT